MIDTLVDGASYQAVIVYNPDLNLDFQDIKNGLISKQFKIVSRTPEILKLKIAMISVEFKNVEKMVIKTLK